MKLRFFLLLYFMASRLLAQVSLDISIPKSPTTQFDFVLVDVPEIPVNAKSPKKAYWISRYEVSQEQWAEIMEPGLQPGENAPIVRLKTLVCFKFTPSFMHSMPKQERPIAFPIRGSGNMRHAEGNLAEVTALVGAILSMRWLGTAKTAKAKPNRLAKKNPTNWACLI